MLKSDKSKVREILQNLLANAIKYTDRGEIELRVLYLTDGQAGGSQGKRISIAVRDTRVGIKKADMPHISEAFYRGVGGGPEQTSRHGLRSKHCQATRGVASGGYPSGE